LDASFKSGEPGVCRLVRTSTKCFGAGSGGDEKWLLGAVLCIRRKFSQ